MWSFRHADLEVKLVQTKTEVVEKPWGLPVPPGLMALFTFQMSSLKKEHKNCSSTFQCLQSNLSLGFHKQFSIGSVTVCAMYRKSRYVGHVK